MNKACDLQGTDCVQFFDTMSRIVKILLQLFSGCIK